MGNKRIAMNLNAIDREQQIFDAVPESARAARKFVGEILRQRHAPESVIVDFKLAVSELVANAIEHGDGSELTVEVDFSDDHWWEIGVTGGSVATQESLKSAITWKVPGYEHASGRGLGIVKHLMSDVITDVTDGHVRIRGRRRRTEN